jgi:hypothetical protein
MAKFGEQEVSARTDAAAISRSGARYAELGR